MNYTFNAFEYTLPLDISLSREEAIMLLLEMENIEFGNDTRYPSGKLRKALREFEKNTL